MVDDLLLCDDAELDAIWLKQYPADPRIDVSNAQQGHLPVRLSGCLFAAL